MGGKSECASASVVVGCMCCVRGCEGGEACCVVGVFVTGWEDNCQRNECAKSMSWQVVKCGSVWVELLLCCAAAADGDAPLLWLLPCSAECFSRLLASVERMVLPAGVLCSPVWPTATAASHRAVCVLVEGVESDRL